MIFEELWKRLSSEQEGEAGRLYLQERVGFEKMQPKQMEREVAATKAWGGGRRVALHLDPVVAAASETLLCPFLCPTTKSYTRFSRWGLLSADDLSLGRLACWPLHDVFVARCCYCEML